MRSAGVVIKHRFHPLTRSANSTPSDKGQISTGEDEASFYLILISLWRTCRILRPTRTGHTVDKRCQDFFSRYHKDQVLGESWPGNLKHRWMLRKITRFVFLANLIPRLLSAQRLSWGIGEKAADSSHLWLWSSASSSQIHRSFPTSLNQTRPPVQPNITYSPVSLCDTFSKAVTGVHDKYKTDKLILKTS